MSSTSLSPRWVSCNGVTFLLPGGWQSNTERTFGQTGAPERYVAWLQLEQEPARVHEWFLRRREALIEYNAGRASVGDMWSVPHPYWSIYGFMTTYGPTQDSPAMLLHVVETEFGCWLTTCGSLASEAGLTFQMLGTLALRVPGARLPVGRYGVYDFSFVWPYPLANPGMYGFESPARESSFEVRWDDSSLETHEPDWVVMFSVDPEAQVWLEERNRIPMQAGQIPPPFATDYSKLVLDVASWRARESTGRVLSYWDARGRFGAHTLRIRYRSTAEPFVAYSEWAALVASLNVEVA